MGKKKKKRKEKGITVEKNCQLVKNLEVTLEVNFHAFFIYCTWGEVFLS